LLRVGGFSLISAKPKVGKSTIARQLALSVSRGGSFLGRSAIAGKVLYISLEEIRQEIRNHFRILGATGEDNLEIFVGSLPKDPIEWLGVAIKKHKPNLVIIDTLFRITRVVNLNDYAQVTEALDPILELARDNAVHIMGIHHSRKGESSGGDGILGSTAILGSVDNAIMMDRDKTSQTIKSIQRYGCDIEETHLIFDESTKSFEMGENKEVKIFESHKSNIVNFLRSTNKQVSRDEIESNIKGSTSNKRQSLRELVEEGTVRQSGEGVRGKPHMYSCFPVSAPTQETIKQAMSKSNSLMI